MSAPTAGSPDRWQLLETLFDVGVLLPPMQRAAWLGNLTIDGSLRDELARLLSADDGSSTLRDRISAALLTDSPPPALGTRIGAWRLIEQLGSGGMGTVYKVERVHGGFTQQAALKLIRGVVTPTAARQLRRERQILADLRHPGIARLLDGGETEQGQPYLVLEFVHGDPVNAAVKSRETTLDDRLRLVIEVARAVHHAHQNLIVHCDIKPANVLLQDDGRPILVDFGIAALLQPGTPGAAGEGYFTPGYASPEQQAGRPPSTATDIHALGLLLAELLTGQPPLMRPDRSALPNTGALAGYRGRDELQAVIARACAAEPEARYASAAELADDLERVLARKPVRAVPATRGYVLRKLVDRHRFASAGALIMLGLLVVFSARLFVERNRALEAERISTREAATAQAVTGYLVELFEQAGPAAAGNRPLAPAALIDRGVERLQQQPGVAAEQRARLLVALGTIYYHLGLPGKASAVMRDAIAAARDGGDPATLAIALSAAGKALIERGKAADAQRMLEEAEPLFADEGDLHRAAEARLFLGIAQSRAGDFVAAERTLDAAREAMLQAGQASATELAMVDVYRTEVLRETGREQLAVEQLESLLQQLEAALPPDHPDLFVARGKYVHLLLRLGRRDDAQAILETMLAGRDKVFAGTSAGAALLHNSLGALYHQQGRTADALVQMEAALAVQQRILGADDPALAIGLNNIGTLYREIGDYARATPPLRRALHIATGESQPRPPLLVQIRQNLGLVLLLDGRAAEARDLLEAPIEGDGQVIATSRAMQQVYLAEWHRRFGTLDDATTAAAAAASEVAALGGEDSIRFAELQRIRGLIAAARAEREAARTLLAQARDIAARARGERYVRVAEIDLDLAELALAAGRRDEARTRLASARPTIESLMAPGAPQRQRVTGLRSALGAG